MAIQQNEGVRRKAFHQHIKAGYTYVCGRPFLQMYMNWGDCLNSNKAVAEGAVSFYLDHFVSARIARFTYGTTYSDVFNPGDTEHIARGHKAYIDCAGHKLVPGAFGSILRKGTRVSEEKEFARSLCHVWRERGDQITADVVRYTGEGGYPRWTDMEPDKFDTLCEITGDVSDIPMVAQCGRKGIYYQQDYNVVLLFGLTELKAELRWEDRGEEKRCPASIIYENDGDLGLVATP